MKKYQRNKNTVASKLDDELVMIDIDLGKYFSLNQVASSIWDCLDSPKTSDEICADLMEIYTIDKAQCEQELKVFLNELMQMKLIAELNE